MRANCVLSLLTDPVRVMAYVDKYPTNPECRSNVFNRAFDTAFSQLNTHAETYFLLRHFMIRVLGQRDITVQETSHHILSNFQS